MIFRRLSGKKAQAAMEFLMTYGWAILVVLAAIGALAYFGVLSPSKFIPESCTLAATSGIACIDFSATSSSVHLYLINGGGRDLQINNISIGDCSKTFNVDLVDGASVLFNITGCSFGTSEKIKNDLTLSYTDKMSGFTKTTSGTIVAKIS